MLKTLSRKDPAQRRGGGGGGGGDRVTGGSTAPGMWHQLSGLGDGLPSVMARAQSRNPGTPGLASPRASAALVGGVPPHGAGTGTGTGQIGSVEGRALV